MKIVLKSFNYYYDKMAILDTDSGEFIEFSRIDRPDLAKLVKTPCEGLFSYVENRLICFYYPNPKHGVRLKVDNDLIEIDYGDKVSLEKKSESQNLFRIQKDEKTVFSLVYNRPIIDPPLGFHQMVSMVEEEDFDFLLLIYNIFNKPSRKDRFFGRDASFDKFYEYLKDNMDLLD